MTEAPASEVGCLLADLFVIGNAAPELVAQELRPLVESLRARHRACFRCGKWFVQKRHRSGPHAFCETSCRVAWDRDTQRRQTA